MFLETLGSKLVLTSMKRSATMTKPLTLRGDLRKMSCILSKFEVYPIRSVGFDRATNTHRVEISSPPDSCPGGVFVAKRASLTVNAGEVPSISYDVDEGHPVITVPTSEYVTPFNDYPSFGFDDFFFLSVIGLGFILVASELIKLGGSTYKNTREDLNASDVEGQTAESATKDVRDPK